MSLHLIKLCVGCDQVRDLQAWIRARLNEQKRRGHKPEHIHITRMMPKLAAELAAGGSLYWVIRGEVLCRERIVDVRAMVDRHGISRCQLVLDGRVRLTEPRPCRAFQGWRYLAAADAPKDLARAAPGAKHMPEALRRELRGLGLL